jgi:hypothetical protein
MDKAGPRRKALEAWIERINARPMYETESPNHNTLLTVFACNGRVFVVMTYTEYDGFDLFVPAHSSNSIALTLDAAALALGVEGCAGLV